MSGREMAEASLPTRLSLQWAAVAGSTRLTAAEAGGLEEHDVVLIDDAKPVTNGLGCWLGLGPTRRFAGRAMLRTGGQLQIEHLSMGENANMSATTHSVSSGEAGFGEIPVTVRFELAHWNASLADVGRLVSGSIVDLRQPIDGKSVSVWVEERCIGTGQLVALGERLGVRLVSVFNEPEAQESV
jgi:type III secretion protein Q